MAERSILFVDDEASFRTLTSRELARAGYRVEQAGNLTEARRALARQGFDLVLLDVRMPDGSGLDLLPEVREHWPATEVVMLTAYGTVEEAIRAMKQGAHDFLTKPCRLSELEAVLAKALEKQTLQRNHDALSRDVQRMTPGNAVVGDTGDMREMFHLLERVAPTDTTVLIRGESGVGKEVVAREVHRLSLRARQPFIVVDCVSLHENLLQSELFGHEKGAFTDAKEVHRGLFEQANGGTLFLDEIGDLTLPLQAKLLRAVQEHRIKRVGGTDEIEVDIRLVSATNRNLRQMIERREFREDLYYRVRVIEIGLPPLRERTEDIEDMAKYFLEQSAARTDRPVPILTEDALQILKRYEWPGNVRQLKNTIEGAFALAKDNILSSGDFHLGDGSPSLPPRDAMTEPEDTSGYQSLRTQMDAYIREVLEHTGGNITQAAKILKVSRRTLQRMAGRSKAPGTDGDIVTHQESH